MFVRKSPPPQKKKKNYFQSITEEPKYQAKALIVVTDTIKKNRLTAGAAVVVTIPSLIKEYINPDRATCNNVRIVHFSVWVTNSHVDSVTPYPLYRWLAAGLHDKIISQGVRDHRV